MLKSLLSFHYLFHHINKAENPDTLAMSGLQAALQGLEGRAYLEPSGCLISRLFLHSDQDMPWKDIICDVDPRQVTDLRAAPKSLKSMADVFYGKVVMFMQSTRKDCW